MTTIAERLNEVRVRLDAGIPDPPGKPPWPFGMAALRALLVGYRSKTGDEVAARDETFKDVQRHIRKLTGYTPRPIKPGSDVDTFIHALARQCAYARRCSNQLSESK